MMRPPDRSHSVTVRNHIFCKLLPTVFSLCIFVPVNSESCFVNGSQRPGWTSPRGNIIVKKGESSNITCVLSEESTRNCNSANIFFYADDELVHRSFTSVINNSAKSVLIDSATESKTRYDCFLLPDTALIGVAEGLEKTDINLVPNRLENVLIDSNVVFVGTAPQMIRRIDCFLLAEFSDQSVLCHWVAPQNFVLTTYVLKIYATEDAEFGLPIHTCPTVTTDPTFLADTYYRTDCDSGGISSLVSGRNISGLTMKMTIENCFGNATTRVFALNVNNSLHRRICQNLTALEEKCTNIFFKWNIRVLENYTGPLLYQIEYKYMWEGSAAITKNYSSNALIPNEVGDIFLNLTDLLPNRWIDITIVIIMEPEASAVFPEEPCSATFRTVACRPFRSPKADIGSFEVQHWSSRRYVWVYWQPLSEFEYNADGFHYDVKAYRENNNTIWLPPIFIENSYAKFDMDDVAYRVLVRSVNEIGAADVPTEIRVPSGRKTIRKFLKKFTLEYFNDTHDLEWKLSRNLKDERVVNLTLFERGGNDSSFGPGSPVYSWKHLNIQQQNASLSKDYEYAISVNTINYSSGFLRPQYPSYALYLLDQQLHFDEIGGHYISVSWVLSCGFYADHKEYILMLSVCQMELVSSDMSCEGNRSDYIVDINQTRFVFRNLSFYTTYAISMKVDLRNSTADYVFVAMTTDINATTLEGPPDVSDLKIKVLCVGNFSANISWNTPGLMNGKLQNYIIDYGKKSKNVSANKNIIELNDLSSYSEYDVKIRACTSHCSHQSSSEPFRTDVGPPSGLDIECTPPSSYVTCNWTKPVFPAGPNPHYKFEILKGRGSNFIIVDSFHLRENILTTPTIDCSDKTITYKFRVRAENNDSVPHPACRYPRVTHHVGPWSSAWPHDCSVLTNASGVSWIIILSIVLWFLLLVLFLAYVGYQNYYRWERMKLVEIRLPLIFMIPYDPLDSKGYAPNPPEDDDVGSNTELNKLRDFFKTEGEFEFEY